MPAHRRPPISIFIPSLVLLLAGVGTVVAALGNVVLVHTVASVAPAVLAVTVGVPAIMAAWHLYGGNRLAWMAALGLLPMVGAVRFLDVWANDAGRIPVVSGVIVPAGALACLVLPSARAFIGPP